MAFAALLGTVGQATAAPLLSPARGSSPLAGVRGVQRLALDRDALADLRGRDHVVVPAFPLGRRRTVDLVLTRLEPFPPDARVEVMEADGPRALALPDRVWFGGSVAGEDGSRAFLAAGRDRVHGFVVSDGDVYPFGPDGHGAHRSYALRDVDPLVHPAPGDFCANDLHPEALNIPAAEAEALAAPPVADAAATLKVADIAIETDQELRAKFASDAAALDYLASLAAATSAIYERDVSVRLRFSYIRLWGATATDPWTATSTSATLTELRGYWNDPANGMAAIAGPRAAVHFVSGKGVQGGIAYVNALCSPSYGYGVSQVYGAFDLSRPSQIWDVMVVSHELGHNFGSPHSHCYSPPVDRCYNQEANCYSGSVVASRGTIMSYCHLLGGGLSNIDLVFGTVVSTRIGQSVASAACLGTVATTSTTSSTTTSTTATTVPTTVTTSSSTTTSTRPPTSTTTTSSTLRPTTTTASTSTSSTTRPPTTSTTTSTTATTTPTTVTTSSSTASTSASTSSTTSTTVPSTTDGDGDGVLDGSDACPDTPAGELVDASGCSVCPCEGPSRAGYLRCVRAESGRRLALGSVGRPARRAMVATARRSTCGRPGTTRCCVYAGTTDAIGRCRVTSRSSCELRGVALGAADLGPGSCALASCTRAIGR